MLTEPFIQALPVLEELEENGYEAYFVGGSVRDALLGRSVGDIDIATSAQPEEVTGLFKKVIPVGIKHGTVIVRFKGESYEVTTFRTESSYSDFRHPDQVNFVKDIKEDLARRDFTVNAIAMDRHGYIIDPFDGKTDIKKRLVTAVGQPDARFKEDPLRMMRAIRFVSQLDFNLERDTEKAISITRYLLEKISVERIAMEVEKLFAGTNVNKSLELFRQTGLAGYVPVWKDEPWLIEKYRKKAVSFYSMEEIIAFSMLLGAKTSLTSWIKQWKLSNQVKLNTLSLLDALNVFEKNGLVNWLVYKLPQPLWDGFIRLLEACYDSGVSTSDLKQVYQGLPIKGKNELAIDGNDIVSLFPNRQKGGWIREMIEKAEWEVVNGNLPNNNTEIKEWVRNGEHPQTAD